MKSLRGITNTVKVNNNNNNNNKTGQYLSYLLSCRHSIVSLCVFMLKVIIFGHRIWSSRDERNCRRDLLKKLNERRGKNEKLTYDLRSPYAVNKRFFFSLTNVQYHVLPKPDWKSAKQKL